MTPVLFSVIASAPLKVVTTATPLPRIVAGMPAGVEGVTRVMVVAKALLHQNHDARPTTVWRLVD